MQPLSKSEKFWDRTAAGYEKQPIKDEQAFQKTIENIVKHLGRSDRVLDYACGTGTISNKLAGSVKEIHAIDISSRMIAFAIDKAAALGIENIHHSKTTLFDKRLEKAQFDAVLAFNILHLTGDLHAVVQRINQLLKPGGLLITSTPCLARRRSLLGMVAFLLRKLGIVPDLNMPTFSKLETEIKNGRFVIIETEMPRRNSINSFLVARKL